MNYQLTLDLVTNRWAQAALSLRAYRQKGGPDHSVVLLLCVSILLPSVNRLSKGGMIRKERIKKENLEARDSNGGPGG